MLEIKGDEFVDCCFTKNKLITLTQKGDVYIYDINVEILNQEQLKMFKVPEIVNSSLNTEPRKVNELKNIAEISAGERHVLCLDKQGNVWSFGDDTYG